jgi:hypothetical protein
MISCGLRKIDADHPPRNRGTATRTGTLPSGMKMLRFPDPNGTTPALMEE